MNCQICFTNQPLIKPGECQHEFCKMCIQLYIIDTINNGNVFLITCPSCKSEYSSAMIKDYCPNLYQRYLELRQKAVVKCSHCKENIKKHKCGVKVCIKCGELHKGICPQRCPNCYIPIEKISGCNHMICKCKYEFCWICRGQFTKYHYRLWNICGCAIPGSMMKQIEPLPNPNIIRILMSLPKIIAFILILCLLILIYPFFCFIGTVKFHYKQFKIKKIRILLVLLFPIFFLIQLFFSGVFEAYNKLHQIS